MKGLRRLLQTSGKNLTKLSYEKVLHLLVERLQTVLFSLLKNMLHQVLTPSDLIQEFRTAPFPRIAVTVDMVATGTDIKPVEVVMFLRDVKSEIYYEQMKGRGVRVVSSTELQAATPDAANKTHFVIVDAVGVCERDKTVSQPLDRKPSVSLEKLLQAVATGIVDADIVSTIAGRLARLDRQSSA